jgi:hypothetical protein
VPPSPLPAVTPLSINSNPLSLPKELITRDHGKQKYAIGLIGVWISFSARFDVVHVVVNRRSSCKDVI